MSMAVLFPGQGAQAVGMGQALAERFPACRAVFDEASDVLGYDLAHRCFEGPIEELTPSVHAQPAIFAVSVAAWKALTGARPSWTPAALAGLSSGEWTALHVAGVLSFRDTLRVLQTRGRLMQEACERTQGGMLSVIGADAGTLERVAREAGVEAANFNSPEQTVLSGPVVGIERAEALLKEAGVRKAIRLNVAGAFHSSLMNEAAESFEAWLRDIPLSAPACPVLSNVTGRPHEGPDAIREAMAQQVRSSVRWLDDVRWMLDQGMRAFVECGPGKVLAGLVRRIDKDAKVLNIQDPSGLEDLPDEM